jgi:predicted GNAT family acetyltransferase
MSKDGYTFHHTHETKESYQKKNPHDGLDLSDFSHVTSTHVKHEGKHVGHVVSGHDGKNLHIGDSHLKESHQGKGVGKKMYKEHIAHAAKHGATHVHSAMASDQASHVHSSLSGKAGKHNSHSYAIGDMKKVEELFKTETDSIASHFAGRRKP